MQVSNSERRKAAPVTAAGAERFSVARWGLFLLGLAISVGMALRAQVGPDQYYLLVKGWMLVQEGWLVPFGNHMSAGGYQPGAATSLLVGLPLFVWEDHRAVTLSIVLVHVVAYWLLDRSLRDVLGARGRLLLCIVYWLNPWRLYFSAHLWNPNWLFLLGVVHLWTARKMRCRRSFLYTFLHAAAVGAAFQIHGSFLILALASLLLFLRGYVRVHWPALIFAVLLFLATMIPWVLAALEHPGILPGREEGFLGRGLVTVHPVLKGLGYWLRYPSLFYSQSMTKFDFTTALGAGWDAVLAPVFTTVAVVLGPLSLLVSVLANIRLWRRRPDLRWSRLPGGASPREWVRGYVRWTMIAALASFALSPTTIMMWQALIVLHAAVLPVVFWGETLWRTRRSTVVRRAAAAWVVVVLVFGVAMSLGSPLYRRGGRGAWVLVLSEREMVDRLGVTRRSTVVIDPKNGLRSPLLEGRDDWFVPNDHRRL